MTLGLTQHLETLGFHTVGYGCTSCIGNSGPLPDVVAKKINKEDLVVASVISGNRNFEGRVHPLTKINYLASPPLVVAFALAGTVNINLTSDPIGIGTGNKPIFLKDIWPNQNEILASMEEALTPELFSKTYASVFDGDEIWQQISIPEGDLYQWEPMSTYIQEPPFFFDLALGEKSIQQIKDARVLALLGDSITTDHISPAGSIPSGSPTEKYLFSKGIERVDFNSFGSRRGNHEVMMRGTFGNIRLRNMLVPGSEGSLTKYIPTGETMSIFDASEMYQANNIPLIIIAGKEYGTGSSRDWAAKGPLLLGIKVVIAESYERIHRSNLIGMGILPLQFLQGENVETLGLTGFEAFDVSGLNNRLIPGQLLDVTATDFYWKNHYLFNQNKD